LITRYGQRVVVCRQYGSDKKTLSGPRPDADPGQQEPVCQVDIVPLDYLPDCRRYYACIRHLDWAVWLDSGFPDAGGGRYDIITANPYLKLTSRAGSVVSETFDGVVTRPGVAPLQALRAALGPPASGQGQLPFHGGAVGYLGYDLNRRAQGLVAASGPGDWPDMAVGIYGWVLLVDHVRRRTWFIDNARDPRGDPLGSSILPLLQNPPPASDLDVPIDGELVAQGVGRAAYREAFERIQRYIRDGDCYQVNLAQQFRARVRDDAWQLYRRIRQLNPAPYGALLEYPFGQVLSASPERFLALEQGRFRTEPIKGTRPRGASAQQDQALRGQLLSSDKDRAENLMIVDLLRNDLGRVCVPGSIDVPRLFEVESFATVHHLVSTVTGRLRDGLDAIDLIDACFPGGSITGAPKRRAMEIIDELEPVPRAVYCGSVIRLGFDGNLDSSIAIRTAMLRNQHALYSAGGGIVADSDCDAEYQESLDKAAAFIGLFSR
jgi:para-aminobenzoate synthetase component 1